MDKNIKKVKQLLVLDTGEEIVSVHKAQYFPKISISKQVRKFNRKMSAEIRTNEARKDTELQSGAIVLTNHRIFWMEKRGAFKKTLHTIFFLSLPEIISINMQGRFSKRINIVTSQGELQFRFKDMEKFTKSTLKLIKEYKVRESTKLAPRIIFCKYCGAKNKEDVTKCGNCSALLT